MAQPRPWLDEIIDAMKDIGGHGYYKDIYDRIYERQIMNFNENPSWTSAVRQTIERYSSDSDVFTGIKDIFYSVEGKGKGHWGLRDFEPDSINVDLTEDDTGFPEGKKVLRQHICRERNPRVIMLAKEKFKAEHGKVFCEACHFSFEEKYGNIGEDFIEGHYLIPVSEIPDGYRTKVDDIVLLCSNCHRMIHRKRPWLKRNELSKLFAEE